MKTIKTMFVMSSLLLTMSAIAGEEVSFEDCTVNKSEMAGRKKEKIDSAIKNTAKSIKAATQFLKSAVRTRSKGLRCELMGYASEQLASAKGHHDLAKYLLKGSTSSQGRKPDYYDGRYDKSSIVRNQKSFRDKLSHNSRNLESLVKACKNRRGKAKKSWARSAYAGAYNLEADVNSRHLDIRSHLKLASSKSHEKGRSCQKFLRKLYNNSNNTCSSDFGHDSGINIGGVYNNSRKPLDLKPVGDIRRDIQYPTWHRNQTRSISK